MSASSTAHHATDAVNYASQLFPLGVGASLFLGIKVSDWALLLSILIGVLNVMWFVVRFYDRFNRKTKEAGNAGEGNPTAQTKTTEKPRRH